VDRELRSGSDAAHFRGADGQGASRRRPAGRKPRPRRRYLLRAAHHLVAAGQRPFAAGRDPPRGARHPRHCPRCSSIVAAAGWDRLRLRDLPHGAARWTIRDRAEAAGLRCGIWTSLESPYRALPELPKPVLVANGGKKQKGAKEPQGRYDLVEASLDSKFRQNLRRRKRRLAEVGETSYVLLDGKDAKALDVALADFFSIEASGWKGRGGTAIAQRPELVGFYTQIARDAAKRGALALGFLTHKGVRIASHLSIVHDGKHYLVKLGYDESFHEYSPGQQLTSETIRDSCERGLTEFDFLGADASWHAEGTGLEDAQLADHLPGVGEGKAGPRSAVRAVAGGARGGSCRALCLGEGAGSACLASCAAAEGATSNDAAAESATAAAGDATAAAQSAATAASRAKAAAATAVVRQRQSSPSFDRGQ
jgi:hypothetical protein